MKSSLNIALSAIIGFTFIIASVGTAEAKRMGMGKSFGSKSSHSSPFQRKAAPTAPAAAQPGKTAGAAATPQRSGMMGMLGGLAMGGLLGALFFGGAFENINFMDILIFGLIAFLLYKVFVSGRRRSTMGQQPATNAGPVEFEQEKQQGGYQRTSSQSAFDTDLLFKKSDGTKTEGEGEIASEMVDMDSIQTPTNLPKGFELQNFLNGAESAFARLQQSWDEGDLADIRQFTTDKVFAEIQGQLRERNGENKTEILALQARLIDFNDNGSETEAVVVFKAQLREEEVASDVVEVWHFVRPNRSTQTTWYLDGIQQTS